MLSTTVRAARPCLRRIPGRRFASHEAPQYNEPSGYLFGEKVSYCRVTTALAPTYTSNLSAPATRSEARKGGLGEHLVLGNVRFYGICGGHVVLQARYQVRKLLVL